MFRQRVFSLVTIRVADVAGRDVTSRERPGGRGEGGDEKRGKEKVQMSEPGDDCMLRRTTQNERKKNSNHDSLNLSFVLL